MAYFAGYMNAQSHRSIIGLLCFSLFGLEIICQTSFLSRDCYSNSVRPSVHHSIYHTVVLCQNCCTFHQLFITTWKANHSNLQISTVSPSTCAFYTTWV